MGMYINRDIDILLELCDQVIACLRAHDAGHILDAQGMASHGLELLAEFNILLECVNRACCIADCALRMSACLDALINGGCHVLRVVQGIKDTDDVDSVFNGLADERTDRVIGIMTVAEDVLSSQQHLQLGVLDLGTDKTQSVPRILIQVTEAGIECSASPDFHGIVACFVHCLENAFEVRTRHTCRDLGLVGISKDGFCNIYFSFHLLTSPKKIQIPLII